MRSRRLAANRSKDQALRMSRPMWQLMVVTPLFQQVQKLKPQNLPALRIQKANLHRVQQYLAQRFGRINSLNFPPVRQSIAKRFVHDGYMGESLTNGMQLSG